MEHPFKVAVFDLDGTLLDTSQGMLAAVQYTIDKFGLKPLTPEELRRFIGPPIQHSFAEQYHLEGPMVQELAATFRNRYKDQDLLKAEPYQGIFDVFQSLKDNGILPVVATYKREDYAVTLLKHFGFHKYTDGLFGSDMEGKLKKKDIIEIAVRHAGLDDYTKAVMIGDSDNDAIGAEAIGMPFIGVTYGFGFRTKEDVFQHRAIGAADNCQELLNLILETEK